MKILHVYHEYPKTYQHYLLRPLQELKKFGESKVLTFEKSTQADYVVLSEKGMDMVQRLLFKFGLSKHRTSFEKIASQFDIVHLHHSFLFPKIIPFLDGRIKGNTKFVITLRGADTYLKPQLNERWSSFYNKFGKSISAFIVQSNHQGVYLNQYLKIPSTNIFTSSVSFTLNQELQNYGKQATSVSEIRLISAYRFTWEKNIEGNLRVVRILRDNGFNVVYTICGDGEDLSLLKYFIRRYNLESVVQLTGRLSPLEYSKVLECHSIFLQLSFSEALPASVIEAQGFGLPAIVSDADGIPESIIDGKSGFVITDYNYQEAATKIISLITNEVLYASFSKAAITNVREKFTVEKEVARITSIYNQLLQ